MRRLCIILTFFICVSSIGLYAQNYVQTPVTISKEKVRGSDGNIYYSHVVKERQTLFSIAKAYGVTIDDICKANPASNLRNEGLKNNSIILIPVNTGNAQKFIDRTESSPTSMAQEQDYFIHIVKWYEDINGISRKYGVPADDILKFNNLPNRKLKSRMKLMIPRSPLLKEKRINKQNRKTEEETEIVEEDSSLSIADQLGDLFNWNIFSRKSIVNAVLMLPLKAQETPSESNMDFYCGVLTALKTLEEEGISVDLSVYDVAGGAIPVSAERIKSSDIIIGPVGSADIFKVLSINPDKTPIVSPLDPKAELLVATNQSLIQAPTPYKAQYKDIAQWIASEIHSEDKVVLIAESSPKNTTIKNSLTNELNLANVPFLAYDYNILQGREAADSLLPIMTNSGINRVVIASDSEAFVHDVVRNLNLIKHNGVNIIIYGPAKIRSFDTIEIESLHNLNLHSSSSYFIDYDAPEVKKFLLTYRALYNAEPSQFAFQGYDVAYYFISTCYKYGSGWRRHLSTREKVKMLQSDYKFLRKYDGGFVNNAIRRVVYEKDYTISLLK